MGTVNRGNFETARIVSKKMCIRDRLTGAETMIFSAGGLAGAQGGVCIAAEGTEEQINKAVEICENIKGAKLPDIKGADCAICSMATCAYLDNVGTQKPWIKEIDS